MEHFWLQPSEFLLVPESEKPQPKLQDDPVILPVFNTTDKEKTTTQKVGSAVLLINAMVKLENFSTAKRELINDVSIFSEWLRLLRATARVVLFEDVIRQT